MRISRVFAVACFTVLGLSSGATGTTVRQPRTYSARVKQFLVGTNAPVLYVGKISSVNSGYLPCTVQAMRATTWLVDRALYGFDPGKKIDVLFGSCGLVEAPFKSQNEMLVIAYRGYGNVWIGMKESVVPATEDNIRIARKVMNDYLRSEVRDLVWPPGVRSPRPRPLLVFEGTLLDLGPKLNGTDTGGCPSGVPPAFAVKFQIDQILRGDWTEKEVTVHFLGCGPLRSPPYQAGQRILVFAVRVEPAPPMAFRAGFMLPPEQLAQAEAALDAEAASVRTRRPPNSP
jgi:hypothetical protein